MMYGPVKKLSRVNAQFHQGMACAERVFEVLDTRSEIRDRPSAPPLARPRRDIVFDGVSFTYPDGRGKTVLRDVSFRVAAGQVVAIVGLSGAGKTTLVNLLPRLYDVTAGAVRIDGVDVRDVSLASLRASIGIVTQDTVLFDDTVARNIAYATESADPARRGAGRTVAARIEAAARAAHAHEFIEALPDGYETLIGDRGQRLSGGQRQRLAIARALFRNAPDPDPRRGDVVARHRVRAPGAGSARPPAARPHLVRHRPPAVDRPPGGPDRRARRGRGARDRASRGAPGEAGRASTPGCTRCSSSTRAAAGRPPAPTPPVRWGATHDHVDDRVRLADARRRAGDHRRHRAERQPSLPRRPDPRSAGAGSRSSRRCGAGSSAASRAGGWS